MLCMLVDTRCMTSGLVGSGPGEGPMRPDIGLGGHGIVLAAQPPLPGDLGGDARAGIPVRPSGTHIPSAMSQLPAGFGDCGLRGQGPPSLAPRPPGSTLARGCIPWRALCTGPPAGPRMSAGANDWRRGGGRGGRPEARGGPAYTLWREPPDAQDLNCHLTSPGHTCRKKEAQKAEGDRNALPT